MMHFFSLAKNYSEKDIFEIAFRLVSADSNCTAVSKGGIIQNTKLRIAHSKFFGIGINTNIFLRISDLYIPPHIVVKKNLLQKLFQCIANSKLKLIAIGGFSHGLTCR